MRHFYLLVVFFFPLTACAADWPQWLGPQRNGAIDATIPAGPAKPESWRQWRRCAADQATEASRRRRQSRGRRRQRAGKNDAWYASLSMHGQGKWLSVKV